MISEKKNYKVQFSVGITPNVFRSAVKILETGRGPSTIRTSFLPPAWLQKIKSITVILYRSASGDHITVCDMILLFVHLRDFQVRVCFDVVNKLTVPIFTGLLYLKQFMSSIRQRTNDCPCALQFSRICVGISPHR